MASRRKFKRYDNPTKTYTLRYTPEETLAFAQKCRRNRLANPTEAEERCGEILRSNGIQFEREVIYENGDHPVICDFIVQLNDGSAVCFEIDGGYHKRQLGKDRGRDKWLLERWGIRTVRISNHAVLHETEAVKHQVMELLK